ncbi:MAG TPA: thymidylate kinase, partial [Ktedonobacteraceae bacterium]
GLALQPDITFYLNISLQDLVPRVLQRGGFEYWESGMDMRLGPDLYDCFVRYQTLLLNEFKRMAQPYSFHVIDASLAADQIIEQLKQQIMPLLPHG